MTTNHDSRTRVPTEDVEYDEDALRDAEDKMHAQGTGGDDEAANDRQGHLVEYVRREAIRATLIESRRITGVTNEDSREP